MLECFNGCDFNFQTQSMPLFLGVEDLNTRDKDYQLDNLNRNFDMA